MTTARRSLKHSASFGVLGFVLPTLTVIIAYPVLLARVGAVTFGWYALIASATGAAALLELGVTTALIRRVAQVNSRNDITLLGRVLSSALWFFVVVYGLASLGLVIFADNATILLGVTGSSGLQFTGALRISALQLFCAGMSAFVIAILKSYERFDFSAGIMSLTSVLVNVGAMIGVWLVAPSLLVMVSAATAASVMALVVGSVALSRTINMGGARPPLGRPSWEETLILLVQGLPIALHGVSGYLFGNFQRTAIGVIHGPSELSPFVLAQTAVSRVHSLVAAGLEPLLPAASTTRDGATLYRSYRRMFGAGVVVSAVLLSAVYFAAPTVFSLWVGKSMAGAIIPLLPPILITFFCVSLSAAPYYVINARGNPWTIVFFDAVNVAIALAAVSILWIDGRSLHDILWGIAISNFLTAVLYQTAVWMVIMPRVLGREKPAVRNVGHDDLE